MGSRATGHDRKQQAVEAAVVMLCNGVSAGAVEEAIAKTFSLPLPKARSVVQAAKRKIVQAAYSNREEELGVAIHRLHELYRRAMATQDNRTALEAQKELNRLLGLYQRASTTEGGPTNSAEAQARKYLEQVGLGDAKTPLPELCRRAALRIMNQHHET